MKSMEKQHFISLQKLVLAGVVVVVSGCVQTATRFSDIDSGTTAESLSARYPEGSIDSVATADRALAEVSAERPTIRRQLAKDERACYERFFTNLCLNRVEERERSALEQLRRVEIEANAFKRRERAGLHGQRKESSENRLLPMPVGTEAPPVSRPGKAD